MMYKDVDAERNRRLQAVRPTVKPAWDSVKAKYAEVGVAVPKRIKIVAEVFNIIMEQVVEYGPSTRLQVKQDISFLGSSNIVALIEEQMEQDGY